MSDLTIFKIVLGIFSAWVVWKIIWNLILAFYKPISDLRHKAIVEQGPEYVRNEAICKFFSYMIIVYLVIKIWIAVFSDKVEVVFNTTP